jgi:hypothetical protein
MKVNIAILEMLLLVEFLHSQSGTIKIIKKDGQQISVAATAGLKMTFAKDRMTARLFISTLMPAMIILSLLK